MTRKANILDLMFALRRVPAGLARSSANRKHRKLMRTAKRFAIADMPENTFGKLVGHVRPADKRLIEAPLSGRLCVYYEVYVDAMMDSTLVSVVASEQEGMRFVVEDQSGRALVDPASAVMSTGIDHVTRSTMYLMTEREEALIMRKKLAGQRFAFADGLRFREAILECDEKIAVYGGGVRERDPDATPGTYRDDAMTRLCLSGSTRFPLFISDDPRAVL